MTSWKVAIVLLALLSPSVNGRGHGIHLRSILKDSADIQKGAETQSSNLLLRALKLEEDTGPPTDKLYRPENVIVNANGTWSTTTNPESGKRSKPIRVIRRGEPHNLGRECTITDVTGGSEVRLATSNIEDNFPVGEYQATKLNQCAEDATLYVIFNPWNENDDVFLPNEADRKEYVLRENGYIWVGNARQNSPRPWEFGQFSMVVLKTAMFLLKRGRSRIGSEDRRDPAEVAKAFSGWLNSANGNTGVLAGKWGTDFSDGVPPTHWTGSLAIIRKYEEQGYNSPVKYGQCWVFAGLFTTFMRALGIPARPVTTFDSGHDHGGNNPEDGEHFDFAIDQFFDLNLSYMSALSQDSVWNFHVWIEIFTKRPKLKSDNSWQKGFITNPKEWQPSKGVNPDGWQATDATPQERARNGLYECGPAPVEVIRNMDKVVVPKTRYDVGFVIGEVNAIKRQWKEIEDKSACTSSTLFKSTKVFCLHATIPDASGTSILTKEAGFEKAVEMKSFYRTAIPRTFEEEDDDYPIFIHQGDSVAKVDNNMLFHIGKDLVIKGEFEIVHMVSIQLFATDYTRETLVEIPVVQRKTSHVGLIEAVLKMEDLIPQLSWTTYFDLIVNVRLSETDVLIKTANFQLLPESLPKREWVKISHQPIQDGDDVKVYVIDVNIPSTALPFSVTSSELTVSGEEIVLCKSDPRSADGAIISDSVKEYCSDRFSDLVVPVMFDKARGSSPTKVFAIVQRHTQAKKVYFSLDSDEYSEIVFDFPLPV